MSSTTFRVKSSHRFLKSSGEINQTQPSLSNFLNGKKKRNRKYHTMPLSTAMVSKAGMVIKQEPRAQEDYI